MVLFGIYNLKEISKFDADSWTNLIEILGKLFEDRDELLKKVLNLEKEVSSLKKFNKDLSDKLDKSTKVAEDMDKQMDETIKEIRASANSALEKVENVKQSTQDAHGKIEELQNNSISSADSMQDQIISDLSSSIEVQENVKNKNCLILKMLSQNGTRFFPNETPKTRVKEALKKLNSNVTDEILKSVKHVKTLKNDVLKLILKPNQTSKFVKFIHQNKENEGGQFKFQCFTSLITRAKKGKGKLYF